MKFLHGMIRVNDIKQSLQFYCDFLGLKVAEISTLEDCKLYFLKDECENPAIELTDNFEKPVGGYKLGECFGHFAFQINNFDEIEKKLENFGYSWSLAPFTLNRVDEPERKTKIAFIEDPNGVEIELIEKE